MICGNGDLEPPCNSRAGLYVQRRSEAASDISAEALDGNHVQHPEPEQSAGRVGCQRAGDDEDLDEFAAGDVDDNVETRYPQLADGILRKAAGGARARRECRSPVCSFAAPLVTCSLVLRAPWTAA